MNSIYCKSKKIFIAFLVLLIFSTPILKTFATTVNSTNKSLSVSDTDFQLENLDISSNTTNAKNGRLSSIINKLIERIQSNTDNNTDSDSSESAPKLNKLVKILMNILSKDDTSEDTVPVTDNFSKITVPGYNAHYRDLSTDKAKLIYKYLYSQRSNFIKGTTIDLTNLKSNLGTVTGLEVIVAYQALFSDHPEFLYFLNPGTSVSPMRNQGIILGNTWFLSRSPADLTSDFKKIEQKANAAVQRANKASSTYGKVKAVHDYICENMKYTVNNAHLNGIALGEGQCQAYAMFFQYVMNKLGINSICVKGTTAEGASHVWNRVQVGNKWYMVDCTFDDPIVRSDPNYYDHDYFLKGKSKEHNIINESAYPALSTSDY